MFGSANSPYYPIRQRMFWVGLIQFIATGLGLFLVSSGIDFDLAPWVNWLIGGVNLLVVVGVLTKGTTDAEQNTTPVDYSGEPLNPNYMRVESGSHGGYVPDENYDNGGGI